MTELRPLSLRHKNRLRTRQELLDAVLDLFAEGGLSVCSVEAAAKRAGASKTTAYSYFPEGLDEMLRDIYRLIAQRVLEQATRRRNAEERPEARIFALAQALLVISSEPKVGRFYMMLSPALSPLLEPVVGEASARFKEMITSDLITAGKAPVQAANYAVLISGSLRESATAVAKDPSRQEPLAEAIHDLIDAIMTSSR
ncbi:TetR/AcrR family transcriptional regulator (plasmid) [Mesorhizobium sp. AR07]|uniref:TetR/AcrR family transcriptional regulator n=1 Tax=Mesorhizobium sp. AR07 TaxID=2865838 RepID=UPI00215F33ED|nr:TetR/AcrR family transcriptional regulator [Mesorhizobium sp. AR07]UVK48096.1 TetR/AcrR family transcriptional regulator [Mesorhizobium sp. AR07]